MANRVKHGTRAWLWIAGALLLSGCGRLESIPYEPPHTPASWLAGQPFVTLQLGAQPVVLMQPSSSVLVYLLGVVAIGAGLSLWRRRGGHRSRVWWAAALVLWGAGALSAGTSYQAFSYELKCAGREACAWTTWWEVAYLLLSAASVDAMVVAGAYSSASGPGRRALIAYAALNAALYAVVVVAGAVIPVRFLISFELLLVVAAPGILVLFALSVRRYMALRDSMDLALVGTWLGLGVTLAAYFAYLVSGLTEALWARGTWFSENDVLHLGLIGWMLYIALVVGGRVVDAAATPAARASIVPLKR